MKTKIKNKPIFAKLPRDYAGLVRVLVPRPIRDDTDFANITEVINAMVLYEDEHEPWPERRSPRQRLQNLLKEQGLSGADLSRLLGGSRNLGAMILRGEREITAAHARVLGAHFAMPAGAFIQ